MDYGAPETLTRHTDWETFQAKPRAGRLVLFTTKGATALPEFKFRSDDTLLFGRESAGVPEDVHDSVDSRVIIPIAHGSRSFNLSVSVGIALFEALRQTGQFPKPPA